MKHKFTEDERSRGGAEARWKERTEGKKLNHGMLFGKKIGKNDTRTDSIKRRKINESKTERLC